MELFALEDPRLELYRHVADPQWLRARGFFVAEGRFVVQRLLEHGGYTIESILVTPAAERALESSIGAGVTVHVAEQPVLDSITGFKFHRGCLAIVRRPEQASLSAFAEARRLVVLEGVGNPDNIGGIFRSSAAFAADGVILDRACADPLYRKAVRTSMGAVLRLPFALTDSSAVAIGDVKRMGFLTAGLAPAGRLTLDEFAATLGSNARVAIAAGAEGPGLTAEAMANVDVTVRIPVDPRSDSLNVVVAVSIALQRLCRV
jgi:tRNA G18 (ribose-2'-O)-methylase SpoU